MFPTLVSLEHAVRDINAFAHEQQQGSSLSLSTISLTPAVAPALIARLLNGIEEAFTPDPLLGAEAFFEGVAVPLLHRLPRKHKTHFPMEETLRVRRPEAADAFRCWVVHSLNTVDSLYEAAALLLVGPIVNDATGTVGQEKSMAVGEGKEKAGDFSQFGAERVRRLKESLGPHTTLLNAGYVMQLLSLLPRVWHPSPHGAGPMEGRSVVVQYDFSLAETLPLFREMPREVHVERLRLHRRKRKKRRVSTAAAASAECVSEDNTSQKKTNVSSTKRVPVPRDSTEEEETSDAVMPLWSRLKDIMLSQRSTVDTERMLGHTCNNKTCPNKHCYWDGDEYCYVADASTQTLQHDVCGDSHEEIFGREKEGEEKKSVLNGSNGTRMMTQAKSVSLKCGVAGDGKLSSQTVSTNTEHPSSFMTFVELLDAQEQLERAREELRQKEESVRLRECGLAELEKDYKEKLEMLVHVLHGTRKIYNELVMSPVTGFSGATCEEEAPIAAAVQSRLLNLIEVIYGKPDGEEEAEEEEEEKEDGKRKGRMIATKPIPDTPASRAAAKLKIAQYEKLRQKQLLQERQHATFGAVTSASATGATGPIVLTPVEMPRPLQLRRQAYLCPGCGIALGGAVRSGIFWINKPHRCHYCTQIYCRECHVKQMAVLPFLVLNSWCFTPRSVCKRDYVWLQQNWNKPWYTVGSGERKMKQQCFHSVASRDSVQLARVLRHWFLLCAQMVRGCSEPLSDKLSMLLQTYYAETDVTYSLSDLSGLKYSEDLGTVWRELRGGSFLGPTDGVTSRIGSMLIEPSFMAATVGNVMSAVSFGRLLTSWNLDRSATVAELEEKHTKHRHDSSPGVGRGEAGASLASVESDSSLTHSASTTVSTNASRENERQDFLGYLATQIRLMEQHLHRDCPTCVARATTVCELCEGRDEGARLPLVDAEVVGVRLLERAAVVSGEEEDAPLIRLARVAMQLVRGDNSERRRDVVACGDCGTRYHKACLARARCPHCT
ncbi:hypothetical protein MOQ_008137 [Trypanosoma cruzi marinkellei]|uniref:Rubicon Homology domain-containing protein n=1 Tax=Trypanosoma cruzi marinkellei TaxID=85056 RepID=K2MLT8_TRYCR|nr:hypothetical protein MOQ_008137 [Trypanosoma cruzi marinkellei]